MLAVLEPMIGYTHDMDARTGDDAKFRWGGKRWGGGGVIVGPKEGRRSHLTRNGDCGKRQIARTFMPHYPGGN